jgi:hypothetical protein
MNWLSVWVEGVHGDAEGRPYGNLRAAVAVAKRKLQGLARQLETDHPSAAESLREGLHETLTIVGLGLSPTLRRR